MTQEKLRVGTKNRIERVVWQSTGRTRNRKLDWVNKIKNIWDRKNHLWWQRRGGGSRDSKTLCVERDIYRTRSGDSLPRQKETVL